MIQEAMAFRNIHLAGTPDVETHSVVAVGQPERLET